MTFTVRPAASGGWLAFASGPLLLAVPDGALDVAAAWGAVAGASGFQSALDLLTGKGLAATPSFVLVDWVAGGGDARVLVRGDLELTITDASGEQRLSGAGVSTWVERSLPGVSALSLSVPGATAASTSELPLASGVALVASIATEGAPAAVVAAPSLPAAPSAAPEPVIEVDIGETVREAPDAPAAVVPVAVVPVAVVPAPEAPQTEGYDYLFGDTMYRGVLDAAVHEPDAESEPAVAVDVDDTLHDGETVMADSVKKLRGKRTPPTDAPVAPALPKAAQLVLIMPNGTREPLTQPILIGRSPTVGKVSGAIPRPLTLGTGDQDISRNHAQFALEGGTVVVTDLHSRNGTSVVLPGKKAQKLRAGEPTSIIVGTIVDFGGGLTISVEEEA